MSFIPETEIVRAVQRKVGVRVDGIAGIETWKGIYHRLVGDEPLTNLPDAIRAIQGALNFPAFARDGIAGAATWNGIRLALGGAESSPPSRQDAKEENSGGAASDAGSVLAPSRLGGEPCASPLLFNHWPLEWEAEKFFGYPPNLTQVELPYTMQIEGQPVTRITCHMKVASSLRRIFAAILAHYQGIGGMEKLKADGLATYDGCYNDRSVRGSSRRSMHAYGAAIDLDAEHNPLGATTGRMPRAVVEIFKAEGWRWGGDYHGRKDWMHFEACA